MRTKSASEEEVVVVGVLELPVVITVPLAFGSVIVLSAVGSVTVKYVSKSFAVAPSNYRDLPVVKCNPLL